MHPSSTNLWIMQIVAFLKVYCSLMIKTYLSSLRPPWSTKRKVANPQMTGWNEYEPSHLVRISISENAERILLCICLLSNQDKLCLNTRATNAHTHKCDVDLCFCFQLEIVTELALRKTWVFERRDTTAFDNHIFPGDNIPRKCCESAIATDCCHIVLHCCPMFAFIN